MDSTRDAGEDAPGGTRTEGTPTLRESVPPVREWVSTFLIGIFMGSADAVPGVSGGTIALIAGIYERLITAITAVTPGRAVRLLKALTPLDGGFSLREVAAVFEEVDAWFLLALVAGVGTAVIIVTRAVHWANENAPVLLFGFFFGLIAASAVVLLRAVSVEDLRTAVAAVVGFLVAFLLSGEAEALSGGGLAVVFVAGAVAVSAMILPGISGSLLLVILGQYTRMSTALSEFTSGLVGTVTGSPTGKVATQGPVILAFILGGLAGLVTVSRAVLRALDDDRDATMAFLVALVVGALRAPVERVRADVGFSVEIVGVFLGVAVLGAVFVLVLDRYSADFDIDDI
jgi:putative membrane protein